jgi:hypothetical protein
MERWQLSTKGVARYSVIENAIKGYLKASQAAEQFWSSPDKTDTQLSDHGHFFVFLRTMIPYRRM